MSLEQIIDKKFSGAVLYGIFEELTEKELSGMGDARKVFEEMLRNLALPSAHGRFGQQPVSLRLKDGSLFVLIPKQANQDNKGRIVGLDDLL